MSIPSQAYFDLILPTKPATDLLAETASKIACSSFEWRYITLVFFNSTVLHGIVAIIQQYAKSVIVSSGTYKPLYAHTTEQYIIFGTDVDDIRNMLDWMRGYQFDNTGRYIIVCQSEDPENCDENQAVTAFWYHKITNVIFLKHSSDCLTGYTYFYDESSCAMTEAVEIKDLQDCLNKTANYSCELFPEKFQNLHRCPLIASTFEQPPYMYLKGDKPTGCDGYLLTIIADAMNATLQVITPHRDEGWGFLDRNGIWLGSFGDIYYDRANISMTSAALIYNRFENFQFSFNYNFVVVGWITSATELQPSSLKLLHPFQVSTHIAVGFTFLLVIATALVIRSDLLHKLNQTLKVTPQNNIVFKSWMICMGISTRTLPKTSFLLTMAFLWIWYTFFVRTMYQAALINSLKSNYYTTNVDTIEEVIEANYKFGGGTALREYFLNYPNVYNKYIGMNASTLLRAFKRIARGQEKIVLSVNVESVNTVLKRHGGGTVHILPQRIVVSPTAIFFKKFSPLADPINLLLQRLTEAGIPDKLYRVFVNPTQKMPKQADNVPLTTDHYKGCYAILFAGWSVSFIFFFCEVCVRLRK